MNILLSAFGSLRAHTTQAAGTSLTRVFTCTTAVQTSCLFPPSCQQHLHLSSAFSTCNQPPDFARLIPHLQTPHLPPRRLKHRFLICHQGAKTSKSSPRKAPLPSTVCTRFHIQVPSPALVHPSQGLSR